MNGLQFIHACLMGMLYGLTIGWMINGWNAIPMMVICIVVTIYTAPELLRSFDV